MALNDAKELSDDVETHDITIDVEPAMYPIDYLHLCPAERMPAEFREDMDLIVSNVAFRYFSAPDLALENCLQALSVGGETRLSVGADSSHFPVKEYAGRLADEYDRLKRLRDQGYIKLDIQGRVLDYKPEKRTEKCYPFRFVCMRKLKSLDGGK